jgi:putative hemolysin
VIWVYVVVVLVLVGVEAVFVAAEIALVSLREGQLHALEERSRRGQRVVRLVRDPNRYLAAVQLGVTITALLSAAFGAVTLSHSAANGLRSIGAGRDLAGVIGFLGVTLLIAFVTLVLGELVPKRLALQRTEAAALAVGPVLDRLALLSRPLIWLLSRVTDLLVRAFGGDPRVNREAISEQELRDLVTAHESLTRDERALIDEVFEAGERQLREVMVPRTEVEFIDESLSVARAAELARTLPYSRLPVFRGSHDEVVGFVHIRDLLLPGGPARRGAKVGDLAREVMMLPASKRLLPALSEMRRGGAHLAVVVDEYGGTAGIVTLEDLIEELVGEIRDEYDVGGSEPRRLRGGALEVGGLLNRDDFAETTGVQLPDGPYETVAGYMMSRLGRLPRLGDAVAAPGARLTVAGLDGRRVARVRVALEPTPAAAVGGAAGESAGPP